MRRGLALPERGAEDAAHGRNDGKPLVSEFWTSPPVLAWARWAQDALATTPLHLLARNARAELGPEAGRIALTLARLWRKHREKFPTWTEFCADAEAAEQASGERSALWRAQRFAGCASVLDLCCGAGADTVALSRAAEMVVAVDQDLERLLWARANVRRYGRADRAHFLCADVGHALPRADAAMLDPDRRASGRRQVNPRHYSPPPEIWERIRRHVPDMAVKVAPGIAYEDIPSEAVPEFLEDRGECREAVLWFGDLRPSSRMATVLPDGVSLRADEPESRALGPVGEVIYDPGPALVRAHLITHLAARLGAWRLDEQVAYLSGNKAVITPFAAAFRVEAVWPFHLKRLRAALGERRIGALEIRTRRFPIRPDDLRPQLRLSGERQATLILTKTRDAPVAVLCERLVG